MADNYTRGSYGSLPEAAGDLTTGYSAQDYIDVSSINSVFVLQAATNQIPIHEFKKSVGAAASGSWVFTGKSNFACSTNPIKLEIWKVVGSVWEAADDDSTTAAGETVTLTATLADTTNYLDTGVIAFRVYQEVESLIAYIGSEHFYNYTFINAIDQNQGIGQPFKGDGKKVTSIQFYLRNGSLTGNTYFRLYATTGTYGTDMIPTGDPLATSAVFNASEIPTDGNYYLIKKSMVTPYQTVDETWYAAVIEYEGSDNTNIIYFTMTEDLYEGSYSPVVKKASTWSHSGVNNSIFYVYGIS